MKKSPTIRLLLGLLITLAAVTGFSSYSLYQLHKLRDLQTKTIDANRHDSILLLRVLNDVNTLGLKLQDMTVRPQAASVSEYRAEFDHVRSDLDEAIKADTELAPITRQAETQKQLVDSLERFWATSNGVFKSAASGRETAARRIASHDLSDQQIIMARSVSKLLEQNNAAEEHADAKVASIYDGAERDTYLFLTAIMIAIVVTSLYLIYSNRKIFDKLQSLSRQRRVLAAKLISVQEEVLRSVSRELHDEFGQILTAVSAMLSRAERKGLPPDSPFRTELTEVREITHSTLEKMRSLSQMLHPSILDDYGLAKGIEWYTEVFERQTGIRVTSRVEGEPLRITGPTATHCFRIVQESLNNAAKHSGAKSVDVEMIFSRDTLTINVHDSGSGIPQNRRRSKPGLGLIAMRERAEIVGAELQIVSSPGAGTTVSLSMPLHQEEQVSDAAEAVDFGEVIVRES